MMKRFLLSIATIACLGFAASAQTTYVVSVGIADYLHVSDLRYTENDVASFNKVLKRHTRRVYSLVGSQATHGKVLSTLKSVFGQADTDDTVILFFSGHGYPGGFCCYDMGKDSHRGGLSYKELQGIFKRCKARRKMVFADACFSGGLRTGNAASPDASIRNGNVLFFLSSRTNEVSQEIPNGGNGQFTRFLVRGLGGGADRNRDRIISAKELYNFVHEAVGVATYQKQHPVMWGKFADTMPVLDWNRK